MQKKNYNIEIKRAKHLYSEQWHQFYELCEEIARKHYMEEIRKTRTPDEFRHQKLEAEKNDNTYRQYAVFLDGKAVCWMDESVWNNELYFGFDTVYDEIDEVLLKAVLNKFYEIMNINNFTASFYYTYRRAIYTNLKKAGAAIDEEYIISRLERKDMDADFYKSIILNNPLENWRLEYYSLLPERLLNQFVKFYNQSFLDMFELNPYPAKLPVVNAEYIRSVEEIRLKNGISAPMYILLDDKDEIAGYCSICIDSSKPDTLRHVGALTAVDKKHRGNSIARYLKAKLYLKMLEENKVFRYITTDTMPWNKYMYRINEEFGFIPYRNGCCFKITKKFLENYLKLF